ncbi:cytochrome P450 [Aspergillus unguis]
MLFSIILALLFILTTHIIHRLYFHPLSKTPGPPLLALTSLWLAYKTFVGTECTSIARLHKKYGPVLRIAPNDISIATSDAIEPIYLKGGGFPKTDVYSKFDIEGHATIFSTLTLPERANRAKAVAGLFSTKAIKDRQDVLVSVVDDFVERLRRESSKKGKPVNVLGLTRAMAIDAVTAYLFHERYGALDELQGETGEEVMSASHFVDAYVGVGAFFNFAFGKAGDWLVGIYENMTLPAGTGKSFSAMDEYTGRLINQAVPDKAGSYQSRLLERVSPEQTQIEVKDVCFAGTDSTGMNTATILWYLAKELELYNRLRKALQDNTADSDPLQTPYLRAVVREGLRLAWANPIRLPRSVPQGGWKYKDYFFPPGTSVGVASFELHLDETVFPEATRFKPERWLEPTEEMLNSFFAFGKGTRACIAQNLGLMEVTLAVCRAVQSDVLNGARIVDEKIEILEWFNSRVKGEEILLRWD